MTEALAALLVFLLMLSTWGATQTFKIILLLGSTMISTMALLEAWKLITEML